MDISSPTPERLQEFILQLYLEHEVKKQAEEFNKPANEEKKQFENSLQEITPSLFAEYLETKGVSKSCNLCGHDGLTVPQGGYLDRSALPGDFNSLSNDEKVEAMSKARKMYAGYIFLGEKKTLMQMYRSTYYPMHCINCGNLNLIRARSVLDWFDEQQEQGGVE